MASPPRSKLEKGVEVQLTDLLKGDLRLPRSFRSDALILVQALDCPGLRYAAASMYGDRVSCRVATNCVETAAQEAATTLIPNPNSWESSPKDSVIIGGVKDDRLLRGEKWNEHNFSYPICLIEGEEMECKAAR